MGGMFIRPRQEKIAAPIIVDRTVRPVDTTPIGQGLSNVGKGLGDIGSGLQDLGKGLAILARRKSDEKVDNASILFRVRDIQKRHGDKDYKASGKGEPADHQPGMFQPYGLHATRESPFELPGLMSRHGLEAEGSYDEWAEEMNNYADELTKDFSKAEKDKFWAKNALYYHNAEATMIGFETKELAIGNNNKRKSDAFVRGDGINREIFEEARGIATDYAVMVSYIEEKKRDHMAAGKTEEEAEVLLAHERNSAEQTLRAERETMMTKMSTLLDEDLAQYHEDCVVRCGMSEDEARDATIVEGRRVATTIITNIANEDPETAKWMLHEVGADEQERLNRDVLGLAEEDVQQLDRVIKASERRIQNEKRAEEIDIRRERAEAQEKVLNKCSWDVMEAKTEQDLATVENYLMSDPVREQFKDNPSGVRAVLNFAKAIKGDWDQKYASELRQKQAEQVAMTKAKQEAIKQTATARKNSLSMKVLELDALKFNNAPTSEIQRKQVEVFTMFNLAKDEKLVPVEFLQSMLGDMKRHVTEDTSRAMEEFNRQMGLPYGLTDADIKRDIKEGDLAPMVSTRDRSYEVEPEEYLILRDRYLSAMNRMPPNVNREKYAQDVISNLRYNLQKSKVSEAVGRTTDDIQRLSVESQMDATMAGDAYIRKLNKAIATDKQEEKKESK